jgi:hypothetical protein
VDTRAGAERFVVVPSPSSPVLLSPQQYAVLPVVTAQVCVPPALTAETLRPPVTATGTSAQGTVLFLDKGSVQVVLVGPPTCPDPFIPQQYALPPDVTPQMWSAGPLVLIGPKISPPETVTHVAKQCSTAGWGCIDCKRVLHASMETELVPIRARAKELIASPKTVSDVLAAGAEKASGIAKTTIHEVRAAMGID